MEIDQRDVKAAGVGWVLGAGGVGLWFVDATAGGWGLIVLGGLACGAIAGETANDAAETAMKLVLAPALALSLLGAVGFAVVESGFELSAGLALAVAFVAYVVVGVLPILLMPFVLASLVGGGLRGKLNGRIAAEK